MTVLFDRTKPLFFSSPDPFDGNFDGIVVDAPERVSDFLTDLNLLVEATQLRFLEVGAPEDANQLLADEFVEGFLIVMETYHGQA